MKLHDVMFGKDNSAVVVGDVRTDGFGVALDRTEEKIVVVYETDTGMPTPDTVRRLRALADEIENEVPGARAAGVAAPEANGKVTP